MIQKPKQITLDALAQEALDFGVKHRIAKIPLPSREDGWMPTGEWSKIWGITRENVIKRMKSLLKNGLMECYKADYKTGYFFRIKKAKNAARP